MTDIEYLTLMAVIGVILISAAWCMADDPTLLRLWDAMVLVIRWPFDRLSAIAHRLVRRRSEKNTQV